MSIKHTLAIKTEVDAFLNVAEQTNLDILRPYLGQKIHFSVTQDWNSGALRITFPDRAETIGLNTEDMKLYFPFNITFNMKMISGSPIFVTVVSANIEKEFGRMGKDFIQRYFCKYVLPKVLDTI